MDPAAQGRVPSMPQLAPKLRGRIVESLKDCLGNLGEMRRAAAALTARQLWAHVDCLWAATIVTLKMIPEAAP